MESKCELMFLRRTSPVMWVATVQVISDLDEAAVTADLSRVLGGLPLVDSLHKGDRGVFRDVDPVAAEQADVSPVCCHGNACHGGQFYKKCR